MITMEFHIRILTQDDWPQVQTLMTSNDMPLFGVLADGTRFWGCFDAGRLIGVIGCEAQGQFGLLRSALVHPDYRSQGIMPRLTETFMEHARAAGLTAVYLLTDRAGPYWARYGFVRVDNHEPAQRLANTHQVRAFDQNGWLWTDEAYVRRL
jgi:amino-acid N-acetyltransferase